MLDQPYLSAEMPIPTAMADLSVSLNLVLEGKQIGMIVWALNLVPCNSDMPVSGSAIG